NQAAFHLSERGFALLQQAYPDTDWAEVFGYPHDHLQQAIAALHEQLGCNFVDDLLATMGDRLPTLDNAAAGHYLYHLLTGVEAATGIALYPFLVERFNVPGQARLEWLLRQPLADTREVSWIQDLVLAAGGTSADCQVLGDQVVLTASGWHLIHQVWQGEWDLVPVAIAPETLSPAHSSRPL
ncbi:MAG: hypothetical protein O3C67_10285, partial [Cyanobacteria bacterium]|nr:hypothetical protein [Cyanobacteriota bacterium]